MGPRSLSQGSLLWVESDQTKYCTEVLKRPISLKFYRNFTSVIDNAIITDVSIETHHDEFLRGSQRCGRSAACPSKVPHASHRHAEPEYREHRCDPTPSQLAGPAGLKSQPRWQQPEPQGKKQKTHHQRGDRRDPTRPAIRMLHAPCLRIDHKRLH